jgi:hypothetical protein
MFHGSHPCWMAPTSQLTWALPGHGLLTRAVPHTLTAQELYVLSTVSRLLPPMITSYNHNTDLCSQSQSLPCCWVTSSKSGRSSAPGLMSSQAGGNLTPTSCAYNFMVSKLTCLSLDPHDIALDEPERKPLFLHLLYCRITWPPWQTASETPLPTVLLLHVSISVVAWHPLNHCLTADVFTEPFPQNGCLCWLHSSGS